MPAQHLDEKRGESVTDAAAVNPQPRAEAGEPLSSDGTIRLENLRRWEDAIAEVRGVHHNP